jgi:hypothetical protein
MKIKMLEKLIGAQLVEINERGFVVRKDGELIRFSFIEDYGDCCGFNQIETKLFISKDELQRNPVITNIQEDNTCGEWNDSSNFIITFFGEQKQIAKINSMSSSGSGWCYGASVSLRCLKTKEEEILTIW